MISSDEEKVKNNKIKVILDTDPGINDMQAIFIALSNKDIEVVAITTVIGNGDSELMLKNTERILKNINRTDIPIYQGSNRLLSGETLTPDGYFGKDAMGDIDLPYPENYKKEEMKSHEALVHYINKYPGEIVLLALGPMVNLALAFFNDNDIFKKLNKLYMTGGDVSEKTTLNVTEWAEYNAWCAPVALNVVLKNFDHPTNLLHIINYDFCNKHLVPVKVYEQYYGVNDNWKLNKMGEVAQKSYNFLKDKFKEPGVITTDPFTAYAALYFDEAQISGYRASIKSVVFQGEKKGHTEFEKNENGNLFIIENLNMEHFMSVLLKSVHI